MKYITLHKNGHFVQVKQGFSFTVFFFGFWVYLFRRMWLAGLFWFLVYILTVLASSYLEFQLERGNDDVVWLLIPVYIFWLGFTIYQCCTINKQYKMHLISKGYVEGVKEKIII